MSELKIDSVWGHCPVQAEGTIGDQVFYFRARGGAWALHVAATEGEIFGTDEWVYEEDYGEGPYDAGWMEEQEARAFIEKAAEIYRNRAPERTPRG